jgi:hypothetical protein
VTRALSTRQLSQVRQRSQYLGPRAGTIEDNYVGGVKMPYSAATFKIHGSRTQVHDGSHGSTGPPEAYGSGGPAHTRAGGRPSPSEFAGRESDSHQSGTRVLQYGGAALWLSRTDVLTPSQRPRHGAPFLCGASQGRGGPNCSSLRLLR